MDLAFRHNTLVTLLPFSHNIIFNSKRPITLALRSEKLKVETHAPKLTTTPF